MSDWKLDVKSIGGFRGHKEFSLKSGLNLVQAPNATGKTSLLKAMRMLTNVPEEELIQYLNDYEESGKVTLKNDVKYSVSVSRTKDGVKYLKKENIVDDSNINDIVFVMENNPLIDYVEKGNEESIEKWFRKITDVDRIEVIRDVSTNLYRKLTGSLRDKRIAAEAAQKEFVKSRDQLTNDIEDIKDRIIEIQTNKDFKDISNKLKDLNGEIGKLEDEKKPLDDETNKLKADIGYQENSIKDIDENISRLKTILKRKDDERSQGMDKIGKYESDLSIFKDELKETERDLYGSEEVGDVGLKNRLKDLKDKLNTRETLLPYKSCFTCGRDLDKDDLNHQISDMKLKIASDESKLAEREVKERNLSIKIHDLENEIKKIKTELSREIEDLANKIDKKQESRRGHLSQFNRKTKELESQNNRIETINAEIDSLEDQIKELMSSKNKYLLDEYKALITDRKKKEDQLDGIKAKIMTLEKGELEIKILEDKVEIMEAVVEYYNGRIQAVKEKMRNELNDALMNSFDLLKLAEFEKIHIDENFSLEMRRKGGVYTTLEKLSGIEKTLVAILIAFVTKDTFFDDFPFFVIDEVTNVMDDTRFKQLVEYIEDKVDVMIVTRNAPLKGEPTTLNQRDRKSVV